MDKRSLRQRFMVEDEGCICPKLGPVKIKSKIEGGNKINKGNGNKWHDLLVLYRRIDLNCGS